MFVSFPMYDYPEVTRHTNAWWRALRIALLDHGFADLPGDIERDRSIKQQWRDPTLLLTQTCGYPLKFEYHDYLRAVMIPAYDAPGCSPGRYSSAIVVRDDSMATSFADLKGARLAANGADSQSGFNCVRDMVIGEGGDASFFREVLWTGVHRNSIKAVRTGDADVAAIDAVSFELVRRYAPTEINGIRVLTWGPQAPALPYATALATGNDEVQRMRSAIRAAAETSNGREALSALFIDEFIVAEDKDYEPIMQMHERALASGVTHLAQQQRHLEESING